MIIYSGHHALPTLHAIATSFFIVILKTKVCNRAYWNGTKTMTWRHAPIAIITF
ncbi:MAG: hypothetical protein V3V00_01510 [Saprospiraceae bacterium]